MAEKTCCVTGHKEIPSDCVEFVKKMLHEEVLAAIEDGYTRFISGFSEGAGIMFASIVAEQKKKHPELFLEAVIPYANYIKGKNRKFNELIRVCNGIRSVSTEYSSSSYLQQTRYMVMESERVIAVYDGRNYGGTYFAMQYAHLLDKEIRQINFLSPSN